ncbi:hypothetical protein XH94_13195 [Bradyrhizobium zhanjiangense]|uniref:Uncharacterized protein n=1 Tax=Bradyrhizobium zhanjiangense TaxID=1325107 RepID=A0A4Q0SNL1_9BRAD|nr:hypothetical protein XH94_13195 [Bradyrhizobium zhanjiangense]
MGNREHVSASSITGQAEPAGEPLFAIMPDTAQSCLSAMDAQRLNIPKKVFPNLRTLVHDPAQILDRNPECSSGNDHDTLMRRKMSSQQERSPHGPSIAYDCRFKDASRGDNPQRYES